jgi:hypothetical protein
VQVIGELQQELSDAQQQIARFQEQKKVLKTALRDLEDRYVVVSTEATLTCWAPSGVKPQGGRNPPRPPRMRYWLHMLQCLCVQPWT